MIGGRIAVLVGAMAAACAAALACGGGDPAPADSSGCFLAFDSQFDGFRGWTSVTFDGGADGDAGIHVAGPRTEYINHEPPDGSTAFPVGTLVVKEVGAADPNPANHHLFTMAKRGCDFDAAGAKGWEFIELKEATGGATILWRGVGPPAGETYGGDPNGCNSCHAACTNNDSICSSHLRLPKL